MGNSEHFDWHQQDWIDLTHQWIRDALSRHSINLKGPIVQHQLRPWSAVLLVPAETGDFYFKASADVIAFEPSLTEAIYRWKPGLIPEVLACDAEKSWMLMADGGRRLREVFRAGLDAEKWTEILADYAELQIALVDHSEELISLGVRVRPIAVTFPFIR